MTIKTTVPDNSTDTSTTNQPIGQDLALKSPKKDPLRKTMKSVHSKPTPSIKTSNEIAKQRQRVIKCRAKKALKEEASIQRKEFLIQDNIKLETNISSINMQYQQLMELFRAHNNAQPDIDVFQLLQLN